MIDKVFKLRVEYRVEGFWIENAGQSNEFLRSSNEQLSIYDTVDLSEPMSLVKMLHVIEHIHNEVAQYEASVRAQESTP